MPVGLSRRHVDRRGRLEGEFRRGWKVPKGNLKRRRYPVPAVDRDRLLTTLHLTAEPTAESRALAQALLGQPALLPELADRLAQERSLMSMLGAPATPQSAPPAMACPPMPSRNRP